MEIGELICNWRVPPEKVDLPPNTVHLWAVTLKEASQYLEELRETLAADERAKASRILFAKDRDGFVAVRGALRDVLSRYHPQQPSELGFSYGRYGKPALPLSAGAPPLSFNSSRSGEWGLIALTRSHAVGIDIEFIKPCEDYPAVAANFFSPPEVHALNKLPSELQSHSFLKCWTRKEAISKALGMGFSLEWTAFDSSPVPPERVQIASQGGAKLSVYSFIVAPGYIGSLAFDGVNPTIKFWTWPGPARASFSTQAETIAAPFTNPSILPALPNEVAR